MNAFRHGWLALVALHCAVVMAEPGAAPAAGNQPQVLVRGGFSVDDNRVRLFSPAAGESMKIMVIGDSHLSLDDERGKPFVVYSKRMSGGMGALSFEKNLAFARTNKTDLIVLVGDIFSFPSEAAIEWAQARLAETGIPYIFISGNHDWHYEGMEGADAALRAAWTEKRLKPLYQGNNPLMAVYNVKGWRLVAIDNSTYEITPEQLSFYREQVASGRPFVLLMHIPLYVSGRGLNFGCGHPAWGEKSDTLWKIERRLPWSAGGHTATTFAFRDEVFSSPNLLGVFCGHIHKQSLDSVNGIPQFVCASGVSGSLLSVEFRRGTILSDDAQRQGAGQ